MIDTLKKSSFTPHLNSTFTFYPQGTETPVATELIEVTGQKTDRTESFSLLFKGDQGSVIPQGIQDIRHEQMGILQLFTVPVSFPQSEEGRYYEITFSRLSPLPINDNSDNITET